MTVNLPLAVVGDGPRPAAPAGTGADVTLPQGEAMTR